MNLIADGLSLHCLFNRRFCRLRPAHWEMHVRHEERQAERTRLAQDLHDTALQDFLGASLMLHSAVDQLPLNSPMKPDLCRVLELMGRGFEEARLVIGGLRRTKSDFDDLAEALARIRQEVNSKEQIDFRVLIIGSARQLHAVVRQEAYWIGREALLNAFRHSQASSVLVELRYSSRCFRLVIRDNGCGIDPRVIARGREGHWGLPGMRERAERVGAELRLASRAIAGTEIELSIPSSRAFACGAK